MTETERPPQIEPRASHAGHARRRQPQRRHLRAAGCWRRWTSPAASWRRGAPAGRMVTVAVEAMRFHAPIAVGDLVTCYARVTKTGTTSITVDIETWARRRRGTEEVRVTEGTFIYVAIDDNGRPRPLPEELPEQ